MASPAADTRPLRTQQGRTEERSSGDEWGDRYCTLPMMDSAADSRGQIADSRRTGRLVLLLSAICCLLSAEGLAAYSSRDLFIPIFGRGVGGDGRRYETTLTLTNASSKAADV